MVISQLLTTNYYDPLEACRRAEVAIRYLRWSSKLGLKYDLAPNNFSKWEERDNSMLESVSDASFARTCGRSIGATPIFWAGSLVSWCGGRQPFAAAGTAEAKLFSLTEALVLARAMEPLFAAFHKFKEVKGTLLKGLYTDNTATLQLCQLESGSWHTRHIRLRATIVREALENDEWRAAHLPGLFTSADVTTKAVGPQRLADLMRVMDLYAPHMEVCEDPPKPSVAAVKTSSVATLVLIALLLLTRVCPVRATPNSKTYAWQLELSTLGSISLIVNLICLPTWACFWFTSLRKSWVRDDQTAIQPTLVIKLQLTLAVSCLCNQCRASKPKADPEYTSNYDIWYLLGCAVTLILAWEGLKTFMFKGPNPSLTTPKADVSIQTRKRQVSVGSQTAEVSDPQIEELLETRQKQAQTIRTLQGILGKNNHDLQAVRNWRRNANAVDNICLCPGGTVWHASEVCARQRTSSGLILRQPCEHCGKEPIPMPQILGDILYPDASATQG